MKTETMLKLGLIALVVTTSNIVVIGVSTLGLLSLFGAEYFEKKYLV